MKNIIKLNCIHFFFLFIPLKSFCSDFMPIFYVSPNENDLLNKNSISSLKSKVLNFITTNGISGEDGFSDIVIYPVVNLLIESKIEAMQNLNLYTIEVQLVIKEVKTNLIYNSISVQTKGDGYNKSIAVQNAINNLSFNSAECGEFIKKSKDKITTYYNANCSQLLEDALVFSENDQYERAISICYSIPKSVDCYKEAQKKMLEFYIQYSERKCKKQLLKAKGAETDGQFSQAIKILSSIDPNTSCYKESILVLNEIYDKLLEIELQRTQEIEQERKDALERFKIDKEVDKIRIAAIKEMTIDYFKNNQKTVYQYNYIIR